jgi:hypothetical protein
LGYRLLAQKHRQIGVKTLHGLVKNNKGVLEMANGRRARVASFDGVDLTLICDIEGKHLRHSFRHNLRGRGYVAGVKALVEELLSMGEKDLGLLLYEKARSQTDLKALTHTFFEAKIRGASDKCDYLTLADGSTLEFGGVTNYGQDVVEYSLERGAYLGSFSEKGFRSELDEVLRLGEEALDARIYMGSRDFAKMWLRCHAS